MVVYDERHTQSVRSYVAARACDYSDASDVRREWVRQLRAAAVRTMGFGVVIARRVELSRGTPSKERAGSRCLVQHPGGDAASATMLHGPGLELLQTAMRRALAGTLPLLEAGSLLREPLQPAGTDAQPAAQPESMEATVLARASAAAAAATSGKACRPSGSRCNGLQALDLILGGQFGTFTHK